MAQKPITEQLYSMAVGQRAEFPAERARSIASTASNYGWQWNRKYKTERDRERRLLIVTRLS